MRHRENFSTTKEKGAKGASPTRSGLGKRFGETVGVGVCRMTTRRREGSGATAEKLSVLKKDAVYFLKGEISSLVYRRVGGAEGGAALCRRSVTKVPIPSGEGWDERIILLQEREPESASIGFHAGRGTPSKGERIFFGGRDF